MAKVEFRGATQFNAFFDKLDEDIRIAVQKDILKQVSKPVIRRARALVPQPGYPGDKPSLKPLRDTIGFVIRVYFPSLVISVIGPLRPAGAHGHLVERGHRMVTHAGEEVGFVEGRPFLSAAVDDSHRAMTAAMIRGLKKEFGRSVNKHFRGVGFGPHRR